MIRRCFAAGILVLCCSAAAQPPQPEPIEVIATHCLECHAGPSAWAGIRLDAWEPISEPHPDLLRVVLAAVESGSMPPSDRPPLSDADRSSLTGWLRARLPEQSDEPAAATDPGWFAVRRLSRAEYANSLADTLGIDQGRLDIEASIPHDDLGHGFDNNAAGLSISDIHIEGYLDVAERALDLALGQPVDTDHGFRRLTDLVIDRGGRLRRGGAFLYSNGTVASTYRAPVEATYRVAATAWGMRGGNDLPELAIVINGKVVHVASIAATDAAKPDLVEYEVVLPAGLHEIGAAFTNDYYVKGEADRNLTVVRVEVAGPMHIDPGSRPPLYRALFPDQIPADTDDQRLAAEAAIERLAARVFRRPPDAREIESLVGLYERARYDDESFERATRRSLLATLVSPPFLFLTPDAAPDSEGFIGSYAAASRLAYFLWNGPPDPELIRLAELGILDDPEVIRSQVHRMLNDPRSSRFVESFTGQWLLLRNLPAIEFDRTQFPGYTDELRSSMITEIEHAFAEALGENHPPASLLASGSVFVNEQLASHYGIAGVRGSWFRRVELPEGSPRGGLLTSGAVLALTSNPTHTSPVKRGLFVLDQLLGTPPPPPPPDVPGLTEAAGGVQADLTPRELLALHAADSDCYACHSRMDPIGLALENFDPVGRWRDEMYGRPIDASGELPTGEVFHGPNELRALLLTREEQFTRHLASRLLVYAIGRGLEPSDEGTLDMIMAEFNASKGRGTADLVAAVAASAAFLYHRPREIAEHAAEEARHD